MKNVEVVVELLAGKDMATGISDLLRVSLVGLASGRDPKISGEQIDILWGVYRNHRLSQLDFIAFFTRFIAANLAAYPEYAGYFLGEIAKGISKLDLPEVNERDQMGLVQGCAFGTLISFVPHNDLVTSAWVISELGRPSVLERTTFLGTMLSRQNVNALPPEFSGRLANYVPKVVNTLSLTRGKAFQQRMPIGSIPCNLLNVFAHELLTVYKVAVISEFGKQVYQELLKAFFAEKTFDEKVNLLLGALSHSV
ncbi:MAG: hypothetical protein WCW14_01660 [Candidatus Paceibacterota bacterium]|jgi:hypothetical protein